MKRWLGQSTTGAGVATLLATMGSLIAGTLSWDHALPLLAAAIVGLIWPENAAFQAAAGDTAASVETLIAAYRAGLNEAQAAEPTRQVGSGPSRTGVQG